MYIYEEREMTPTEVSNLPIIGTAVQLISAISLNVIGDNIATTVDGQPVTQSSVKILAVASLNKALSEKSHA